jgi:pyridoxamine 5'-phosphate oxidase
VEHTHEAAPYVIGPGEGLEANMLDPDPFAQFSAWLAAAADAGLPQPNAMVLATVSAAGQPRARTVLLKEHGRRGFAFYTNHTSRKGSDLAAQPKACLMFPWHAMHRQVIIEGTANAMSRADSEPYYRSRPYGSQLGAWASRQSSVLASRADLDDRYAELERRWPPGERVPMPDFWGGYLLVPETIEFWQGRPNRLHDRLRYSREDRGWVIERLSP